MNRPASAHAEIATRARAPHHGSAALCLGLQALAVLAAGIALRLLEWPRWRTDPSAWWQGTPILPSHDAYAWVAGASGNGRMQGWPLSRLVGALADLFSSTPATVAFWLPVVLAPLAGLAMIVYADRARLGRAGLAAGMATVCGVGYLARTRLGFTDTDLFALPLLVALAAGAALAFAPPRSRTGRVQPSGLGAALASAWLLAALTALYPSGYPVAAATLAAGALASLLTRTETRIGATVTILLVIAPAPLLGLAGPVLSTGIALLLRRFGQPGLTWLALGSAVLITLGLLFPPDGAGGASTVLEYLARETVQVRDDAWRLPSVAASIGETGPVDLAERIRLVGQHAVILAAGAIAFIAAAVLRPAVLTFAPLLLLGLASPVLGTRFAMYAAPALGLGLAVVWHEFSARARFGPMPAALGHVVIGLAFLGAAVPITGEFRPRPVLPPAEVELLARLGQQAPEAARIWTWWDLGYAAQYHAGRPTLADGGSTSGRRLLMLARAYAADNSPAAAATIALASPAGRDAGDCGGDNGRDNPDPMSALDGLDARTAQARLDAARPKVAANAAAQYLIVDWHTILRSEWVSLFGHWHLAEGPSGGGKTGRIRPPVDLDIDSGILTTAAGTVELRSLDVLDENGVQNYR